MHNYVDECANYVASLHFEQVPKVAKSVISLAEKSSSLYWEQHMPFLPYTEIARAHLPGFLWQVTAPGESCAPYPSWAQALQPHSPDAVLSCPALSAWPKIWTLLLRLKQTSKSYWDTVSKCLKRFLCISCK